MIHIYTRIHDGFNLVFEHCHCLNIRKRAHRGTALLWLFSHANSLARVWQTLTTVPATLLPSILTRRFNSTSFLHSFVRRETDDCKSDNFRISQQPMFISLLFRSSRMATGQRLRRLGTSAEPDPFTTSPGSLIAIDTNIIRSLY